MFDSSAMLVRLTIVIGQATHEYSWNAGKTLARDMLAYVRDKLVEHGGSLSAVTAIGVKSGPGSYTGLRIGLSVLNTLAEARDVPIVGATGDDWQSECLSRLRSGQSDRIVMPVYGGDPHVTIPRK